MNTQLCRVVTEDKIPLEGLLFESDRKSVSVAVWIGGLSSRFSSHPTRTLALAKDFTDKRIAFAVWDHRGAGIVISIKKDLPGKRAYARCGAAFERFEDCVLDLGAVVGFLKKRGYKNIFLLGHSTGANKAAYYYGKARGIGVKGIGLLGPVSDIPGIRKDLEKNYARALKKSEAMIKSKRGMELLPFSLVNGEFWSAQRFWSIAREGANEDVFPSYDPRRKFPWARNIRVPVLVLIGENDQYADRPVAEILAAFQSRISEKYFTGAILKHADHGFDGKEKELARALVGWVSRSIS